MKEWVSGIVRGKTSDSRLVDEYMSNRNHWDSLAIDYQLK